MSEDKPTNKQKEVDLADFVQRTLVIFKPDSVQRGIVGEILQRFERVGLKIVGMKMVSPDQVLFKKHYEIFSEDLYKTIYVKFYKGLKIQGSTEDNLKNIKKDLKEGIIKMFNQGNFNFEEIDKKYFEIYIQR